MSRARQLIAGSHLDNRGGARAIVLEQSMDHVRPSEAFLVLGLRPSVVLQSGVSTPQRRGNPRGETTVPNVEQGNGSYQQFREILGAPSVGLVGYRGIAVTRGENLGFFFHFGLPFLSSPHNSFREEVRPTTIAAGLKKLSY